MGDRSEDNLLIFQSLILKTAGNVRKIFVLQSPSLSLKLFAVYQEYSRKRGRIITVGTAQQKNRHNHHRAVSAKTASAWHSRECICQAGDWPKRYLVPKTSHEMTIAGNL
ncbi:MAG: hypothetical protein D8M54_12390 [Chloroflexi bacterium]|nr:hypothetical protein [Chloroflexota bacterium]